MTLAEYVKKQYKELSGCDYKIKLIRGQNPKEIFLKGISYKLKEEHLQIYDIVDSNKTIFLINNYPKVLHIEAMNHTSTEILDRTLRAYLDNIEFLSENSTWGIEYDDEEVLPTINLRSHNESQYKTFICARLSDTEAIFDSEGLELTPKSLEKEMWREILKGFNNSNKLYLKIMFDFREDLRKLLDDVPKEFFDDLHKNLDTIEREDVYWISHQDILPNPSLKYRMRDPNWQQTLYNS